MFLFIVNILGDELDSQCLIGVNGSFYLQSELLQYKEHTVIRPSESSSSAVLVSMSAAQLFVVVFAAVEPSQGPAERIMGLTRDISVCPKDSKNERWTWTRQRLKCHVQRLQNLSVEANYEWQNTWCYHTGQ